eukprot:6871979-Alexandrium_andersonii.AAC.1
MGGPSAASRACVVCPRGGSSGPCSSLALVAPSRCPRRRWAAWRRTPRGYLGRFKRLWRCARGSLAAFHAC